MKVRDLIEVMPAETPVEIKPLSTIETQVPSAFTERVLEAMGYIDSQVVLIRKEGERIRILVR